MRRTDSLTLGNGGVQETAGTSSSVVALPDDNGGATAKRVRVTVVTASETAYVLPALSGGAVTAETGLPVAKENPVILNVSGFTHLALLRAGSVDVVLNITPLED